MLLKYLGEVDPRVELGVGVLDRALPGVAVGVDEAGQREQA